ncbi:MAG: hypothetical protein K6F48_03480 [Paludibacteraceae bacterium]|nr:hypothetical protein [Paludibacteraceae bacterium]
MKKLFLAVAMVISTMAASAQSVSDSISESNSSNQMASSESYKPEEGSFMMEVGFAPFHSVIVDEEAGTRTNGSLVNLQGGLLRGVYVISDNLQLKLGFDLSIHKDVNDNNEKGDAWHKSTNRISLFSICPGINYVFDGTNKLAPYIGGELGFGIYSTKVTDESENNKTITKNEGGFNTFGVAAVAGFNYYFAKNIFIGAEVKLGVDMQVDKKLSVEADGRTTTTETKVHSLNFQPQAVPSLRLGWAF